MSDGAAAVEAPDSAPSPDSAASAAAAAVATVIAAANAASERDNEQAEAGLSAEHEMLDESAMKYDHEHDANINEETADAHEAHEAHENHDSTNHAADDSINDESNVSLQQAPPPDASQSQQAPSSATSTPQRERHSLTLDQRRALRRWANAQLTRPSHKQCIEWFQRQYHQTISQSTVSHSLSPKYARLDGEPQLSGSRLRFGNWPEVEKLVLLWYQQMAHSGRHPTNDELGEKAKSIFSQLPRHRGDEPPEFSPGWIHRFKKRYGLLVRRQRRQSGSIGAVGGTSEDPANDVSYLVEVVPRYMSGITVDTNPVAVRETIINNLGIEPSIAICTRVRDEIARYNAAAVAGEASALALGNATSESQANAATAAAAAVAVAAAAAAAANAASPSARDLSNDPQQHGYNGNGGDVYHPHPDEDPEIVLQNALRQLQEKEDAEAAAAQALAAGAAAQQPPATPSQPALGYSASSPATGDATGANAPLRCPFCVNNRMLRTVKEAVEHMATHVVM